MTLEPRLSAALADRYRLERELGGGGMARVYLAHEIALDREVVIKVVAPELAEGLSGDRFAREVKLAARLQQANIVPLLSAGEVDGLPWYTMPYVRGESLRARLATGAPIPLGEAVSLLRDVARALAFAHGEGVIHRDIKPENILLSGGAAVVTDFGIAKAISASRTQEGAASATITQVGNSIGTPAYMAPEQAAGADVDPRADLYAWGVVAYEVLTGTHPFAHRQTVQQLISAHITETPAKLPAAIPADLATLVLQCLEKDPARRPASADEVLARLSAMATVSGERAAAAHTLSRRGVFAAAAIVLLAVAGGWFFGRGRAGTSTDRSVVVLPFANLGAPEDAYFADGVSDEIASQIARIPGMMVVARNSAQRFKGSDRPPQDIAKELGAAYVLSGSVRWARTASATVDGGTEVRIVPALLRTSTGEQVWGEPFQEKLTDVFRVQSDVAERVAQALSVKLGKQQQTVLQSSESRDPAALDAQLLGHSLLRRRGLENLRQAVVQFGRAIARDSSYARAWAGYSLAYSYLPVYFDTTLSVDKAEAEAERAARRAIALDSMLPEAHMALAQVLFHRVRLREALASADRALALDPSSALAHKDRAEILLTQGRVEEAAVSMRRAVALDPLVPVIQADMSVTYMALRQPDSALATIQQLIAFDETNAYWHWTGAMMFAVKGMADSAVASCLRFTPDERFCRTLQLATPDASNRNRELAYLGSLNEHPDARVSAATQAMYYARLGETDSAFARLKVAMQHGEQEFYGPINSPWFDPMKKDPRWDQIVGAAQRR